MGENFSSHRFLVHSVSQMPCVYTVSSISTSIWAHEIHVCWEAWLGPSLFEAPAPLTQDSGMNPLRLGLWVQTGSSCNVSENEAGELCYGKSSTRQSITSYGHVTFHILTDMPMGFKDLVYKANASWDGNIKFPLRKPRNVYVTLSNMFFSS